jgi:hypothetical protein
MTERLKILNEFKDTYMKMQERFATQDSIIRIEAEIKILRSISDQQKGKASQNQMLITAAIAIASLIISIIKLWKQ